MSEVTYESVMNERSLWRRANLLGISSQDSMDVKAKAVPHVVRICADGESSDRIEKRYVIAQEIAGDNWIWSIHANHANWYINGQIDVTYFHFKFEQDAIMFKLSVESL